MIKMEKQTNNEDYVSWLKWAADVSMEMSKGYDVDKAKERIRMREGVYNDWKRN